MEELQKKKYLQSTNAFTFYITSLGLSPTSLD